MPVLSGHLIRLEPLTVEHAAGYLAAAGTKAEAAEVFRWLSPPGGALAQPVTAGDARRHITDALAARARGLRLPYAQLDAATGEFAGTTSYYQVNPVLRTLGIGHTWLGQRWWRTGHNTESKLLMMAFAFETLGAVRVVWHTDSQNTRSQAAIERLGATREGLLRKHCPVRHGGRRLAGRQGGAGRAAGPGRLTGPAWPSRRAAPLTRPGCGSEARLWVIRPGRPRSVCGCRPRSAGSRRCASARR
jgi:RimJ/RimL family protein N-acetyltransferase